jgi:hypothetical protein
MMLTESNDVSHGQANGSRIHLKLIHTKVGEQPMHLMMKSGTILCAFLASQIKKLTFEHEASNIGPHEFDIEAKQFSFDVAMDLNDDFKKTKMHGFQFPVISNSATTGYKLQDYTAGSLFVNDWHYGQNWVYVVLSRV